MKWWELLLVVFGFIFGIVAASEEKTNASVKIAMIIATCVLMSVIVVVIS